MLNRKAKRTTELTYSGYKLNKTIRITALSRSRLKKVECRNLGKVKEGVKEGCTYD